MTLLAVKSPHAIQRETGISHSSVVRITRNYLHLKAFKRAVAQKLNADCKVKCLQRCRQLLKWFPSERSVRSIWFTDEKMFTVATPVNSQNDRVYAGTSHKKDVPTGRLIREHEHFSHKVMVSVGVSRMGRQVWSSLILAQRSTTAPTIVKSSRKGLLTRCRVSKLSLRYHKIWTWVGTSEMALQNVSEMSQWNVPL